MQKAPAHYRIKYTFNKITEIEKRIYYFYQFDNKISKSHHLLSQRPCSEVRTFKLTHLIKIPMPLIKAFIDKLLIIINSINNSSMTLDLGIKLDPHYS